MHVGLDLVFMFVLPKAWTMPDKMETPSRPVSHISPKLLSGLSDKKGASCSHLNQHPPSARSLGCFPSQLSLVERFPQASPYLLYLWLPHPGKAFLQNDTSPWVNRSNEPPVEVPFALRGSIC